MRIAFVIPQLEPSAGGVERYAWTLAHGLAARGVAVTAFTATPPEDVLPPAGVDIAQVAVPPGSRRSRDARFDRAVRAQLGDLAGWDVVQGFGQTTVHTLYRAGGGSHASYLRAMAREWPVWRRWLETARPKHRERIRTQRRIVECARTPLITNSERTRRDLCADYDVSEARIRVIRNGVDLTRFRPAPPARRRECRSRFGLDAKDFAIAFVGSGFARKGLAHAIESLALLREDRVDAHLLVAGRGAAGRYRRLARRRGVADRVCWLGRVRDVEAVYAAADAFVLPSLYEPFGMAPLEAMACGLPVVVTADAGVAEVLKDGREGRLLKRADDAAASATFLGQMARDPAARRSCGRRARHTAETLGLDHHVERVLEVYRAGRADAEGSPRSSTECSPGTPTLRGKP